MNIGGHTKTYGIMGYPVEHTMSPLIHNTIAERMGHDLVYVPFLVEEKDVETALQGAAVLGIKGMNVTVPHKSNVIPHLMDITEMAMDIGAVNTLEYLEQDGKKGYRGHNTDMPGLARAMESDGVKIKGEKVILLGAGGAARAVAFLCVSEGAEKVFVLNKTFSRAQDVAREVNECFRKKAGINVTTTEDVVVPMKLSDYVNLKDEKYLAIQCTSVGLYPDVESAVITDPAFYQKIHTGVDLIYRPYTTRFMSLVREQGGKTCNGLKMLLYQGIIAYEIWNQTRVSDQIASEIYEKMRKELESNE